MGIISTGAKIIGGGIIGVMLASSCSEDNVTEYVQGMQLRQNGEKVVLYHESQNETYSLYIIEDKVYLGDGKHQIIGFQKFVEQKYKGD